MSEPLRVAVIGAGHMGRHHVRKYHEMAGAELVAVIDRDEARAKAVAEPFGAPVATEWSPDMNLQAATIAVPTVHHLPVARPLIEAGIPVLIEKPLAGSVEEADQIATLGRAHNTIVAVGHTERFNPAVRAVDRLGIKPKFIETHRISPFTFRSADVGVVFDMMIHDIDIILHLTRQPLQSVDAVGVNVLGPHEDIANARVNFAKGAVVNLTASRLALKTERKLRIFSESAYVSLDYQTKSGVAITLDQNLDVIQFARERNIDDLSQLAGTDFGQMVHVEPLHIEDKDALEDELESFLQAVRTGSAPAVTAEDGAAAIRLATDIVTSLASHRWDGSSSERTGLQADIFGQAARQG